MKLPEFPSTLQGLNPKQAKFCLGIERFLTRDLALGAELKRSRIVLGLSGGADSTALLLILHYLRPRLGFELLPAHLDHSLRPESFSESLWVRNLCAALNLPCFLKKLDVRDLAKKQGVGLEEAGRQARYCFFASIASGTYDRTYDNPGAAQQPAAPDIIPGIIPADNQRKTAQNGSEHPVSQCFTVFVCTAHHLDDLAEDLLLRLVRGAGWPALAGMKALSPLAASLCDDMKESRPKNRSGGHPPESRALLPETGGSIAARPGLKLLRPLLLTPKLDLTGFLQQLNCPWLEDSSNAALDFRRNRMRNQVMPLLLRENPAFRDSVANLWHLGQVDAEHWEQQLAALQNIVLADSETEAGKTDFFIPIDKLLAHDRATRLRLYKICLRKLGPGQILANSLFALDAAMLKRRSNKIFAFPGYKKVAVEHAGLRFYLTPGLR